MPSDVIEGKLFSKWVKILLFTGEWTWCRPTSDEGKGP